jgi:hypothetical protein
MTEAGVVDVLRAMRVMHGAQLPERPLWLRIEWNRVSLESFVKVRSCPWPRDGEVWWWEVMGG